MRVVELSKPGNLPILPKGWPAKARQLGQEWRESVGECFGRPPRDVEEWWLAVMVAGDEFLESVVDDDFLTAALLKLCLVADEASSGVGLATEEQALDIHRRAEAQLLVNDFLSLAKEVPPSRVCVLPKQHTPQRGMTLRSLSHNLALLPASDVRVEWRPPISPLDPGRDARVLNLLLVPWPLRVGPSNFRVVDATSAHACGLPPGFRYFEFKHDGNATHETELVANLERLLASAERRVGRVDGLVFPELALSWKEYKAIERLAQSQRLLLVAGVRIGGPEAPGFDAPANMCFFSLPVCESSPDGAEPLAQLFSPPRQRKHHRWCLDRRQILQYGLGGVLPASCDCWELTDIRLRSLTFATIQPWLTLSALVCEDLARQDPVSDIMRAVGPNLLFALLMDGPQLRDRWPSRYASVLAEDPGCSVLTLTSLGMAGLSQPLRGHAPRNRVIALWRDVVYGEQELELPDGHDFAVLSLTCESLQEYTADGRGDGGVSHFPVFAGFHTLANA